MPNCTRGGRSTNQRNGPLWHLPNPEHDIETANWLDPVREVLEERATIMEYDGGLSRYDAEEAARIATGYQPFL